MNRFEIPSAAVLTALLCVPLTTSCEVPNNPPEILDLEAQHYELPRASSTTLTAVAEDPDGDELEYIWTTDSCRIDGDGPEAVYVTRQSQDPASTVPCQEGRATITLVVRDPDGLEDLDSLEVDVTF